MMVARLEPPQCIVFGEEGLLLTLELNPTAEFGFNIDGVYLCSVLGSSIIGATQMLSRES